jgi:hypothetical protein
VAPLFPFSGLVAFSSVKAMAISPFLRCRPLKKIHLLDRLPAANGAPSAPSFYVCLTTQKPASVQLTYGAPLASL